MIKKLLAVLYVCNFIVGCHNVNILIAPPIFADSQSLGMYFYDLNPQCEGGFADVPEIIRTTTLGLNQAEETKVDAIAFRSIHFEWKENHAAFALFILAFPSEDNAKAYIARDKWGYGDKHKLRNGRFVLYLITKKKYNLFYIDAFEKLKSDSVGNLRV